MTLRPVLLIYILFMLVFFSGFLFVPMFFELFLLFSSWEDTLFGEFFFIVLESNKNKTNYNFQLSREDFQFLVPKKKEQLQFWSRVFVFLLSSFLFSIQQKKQSEFVCFVLYWQKVEYSPQRGKTRKIGSICLS